MGRGWPDQGQNIVTEHLCASRSMLRSVGFTARSSSSSRSDLEKTTIFQIATVLCMISSLFTSVNILEIMNCRD